MNVPVPVTVPVPPVDPIVTVDVPPKHKIGVWLSVATNCVGSVIVTEPVAVQPAPSVTVTLYDMADSPVAVDVAWPLLHK